MRRVLQEYFKDVIMLLEKENEYTLTMMISVMLLLYIYMDSQDSEKLNRAITGIYSHPYHLVRILLHSDEHVHM